MVIWTIIVYLNYLCETKSSLANASGAVPYPVSSLAHKSSAARTDTTSSLRSVSYQICICTRPLTWRSLAICSYLQKKKKIEK